MGRKAEHAVRPEGGAGGARGEVVLPDVQTDAGHSKGGRKIVIANQRDAGGGAEGSELLQLGDALGSRGVFGAQLHNVRASGEHGAAKFREAMGWRVTRVEDGVEAGGGERMWGGGSHLEYMKPNSRRPTSNIELSTFNIQCRNSHETSGLYIRY
jgi:hypothetical protein